MKNNREEVVYKSVLAEVLSGFVDEMRAVGCKYNKEASALKRFDESCLSVNHSVKSLTKEVVLKWTAKQPHEKETKEL